MIKVNISSILGDQADKEKIIEEEVNKIEGVSLIDKLFIHTRIYKVMNGVLAEISIKGKEKISCNRCLEEFSKNIDKFFAQEYVMPSKQLEGEELEDKYAGFIIDENQEIDLEKPIAEEILLEENRNICSEKCKGICPGCGIDLNIYKCKCKKQEVKNNPFQRLKDMKKTEE